MLDGKWQKAEGPDMARREGMITTVRGRNLGAHARMNLEEGRQYMWAPMAEYVATVGTAPAQGDAWLKAEVERRGDMLEEYGKRVQEARKLAVAAQDAVEKVWRALA
jgi:hypothetical protein